jgi:hypothetical protein
LALGQTVERVLTFRHATPPFARAEMDQAMRQVAQVPEVRWDKALDTDVLRGTIQDIATADWLFALLDRTPDQPLPSPDKLEYALPDGDTRIHVFFLSSVQSPRTLQDLAQVARAGVDLDKLTIHSSPLALAVRGNAEQIALVDWLIRELDKPASAPQVSPARRPYLHRGQPQTAGIFYLGTTGSDGSLGVMQHVFQWIAVIPRTVPFPSRRAIFVRDTSDRVDLAAWLLARLDRSAGMPGHDEYRVSGSSDVVEVFRSSHAWSEPEIREASAALAAAGLRRAILYPAANAYVVRGPALDIARVGRYLSGEGKSAGQ